MVYLVFVYMRFSTCLHQSVKLSTELSSPKEKSWRCILMRNRLGQGLNWIRVFNWRFIIEWINEMRKRSDIIPFWHFYHIWDALEVRAIQLGDICWSVWTYLLSILILSAILHRRIIFCRWVWPGNPPFLYGMQERIYFVVFIDSITLYQSLAASRMLSPLPHI